MAEALGIETRSRSRSKTPGIENGDSGKKSKKIPTISLIEEEDDVVEVPSSQSSQRTKRPRRSNKAVADTSGDVESPKNSQKVIVSSTTTVTETVTKVINGSEEATSTMTVTKSTQNGDESQSIFNNIFNAIKTSTPILSSKKSKRITRNTTSPANVNEADHPAYKEYREAGEYWNKFPKTDYTYSELSPHRRELSNGQVAMPNMSRKSLDKYTARVESMIQNNPLDETFLRRKYLSNTSTSFQKRSADLQYDSQDEVDVSEFRKQLQERRRRNTSIVTRFLTVITTIFTSGIYRVKGLFGAKESYAYTPRRQTKQGFFSSSLESIKTFFLNGFSKVYIFLSTILCLDTWLLYTRSENAVENRKRKRFLLFLLVLLPLLLFGGTYIYLDPPQNLSLSKISLPKLTLPSLPKLSFPKISWPSFSFPELSWPSWLTFSFTWPTISFEWLKFSRPTWLRFPEFSFSWPEISFPTISFAWLKFSRPEWLKFPSFSFSLPEISLPSISWPSFSLPSFSLPSFSLPSISWPSISLPSISLPSMPSFSFDFSPYTGYVGDKFDAFKSSSGEFFGKIRDITFNLIDEAQIVWNDNFNAVSNAQPEVVTEPPPVVAPPPVVTDAI